MSRNVLLALGPHRFEAKGPSYESFERVVAARWDAIDLIGREPAQQFNGLGEMTAAITGAIFPLALGGFRAFERLQEEPAKGRPLILVSGYGRVFGAFGVREVVATETMAFTRGEPQKIDFNISLVRVPRTAFAGGVV